MEIITEYSDHDLDDSEFKSQKQKNLLTVAGDSGSKDYKRVSGYISAWRITLIIYTISLIGVGLGGLLLYVVF